MKVQVTERISYGHSVANEPGLVTFWNKIGVFGKPDSEIGSYNYKNYFLDRKLRSF